MEYTVVSTAVNLASRLESVAETGQILISEETYKQVRDHVQTNKLPPVKLRHISKPVTVYDVLRVKK
jgi:class 3 adenylate cyclase